MRLWNWLAHAFAIPSKEFQPNALQQRVVDRLVAEVARRQLTGAMLFLLESTEPVHFLGGQALLGFSPLLDLVTDRDAVDELAKLLSHPGGGTYLKRRLEAARQRPPDEPERTQQPDEDAPS